MAMNANIECKLYNEWLWYSLLVYPFEILEKKFAYTWRMLFFVDPNLIIYFLRGKKGIINIDRF